MGILWHIISIGLILFADSTLAKNRPKRSLGSWFAKKTTPSPIITYPIWKVHKYTGIHLRPIRPEEHEHHVNAYGGYEGYDPRDTLPQPPSVLEVPDLGAHSYPADEDIQLPPSEEHSDGLSYLPSDNVQGGGLLKLLGLSRSDGHAESKIGLVSGLLLPHLLKKTKPLTSITNLLGVPSIESPEEPENTQGLLGSVYNSITAPKSVYPIRSTIYKEIPESYPSKPSLLSRLPLIGSYFSPPGTPVKLPDPVLPEIPALNLIPEAPKLPTLYLPGPYKVPYSSGSYVNIRLPTPPQVQSAPEAPSPSELAPPVPEYQPPKPEYGPPAPEYQQPQYNPPAPEYQQPQQQYSPAVPEYQQPQQQYSPAVPEYQQPQSHYKPPAVTYQQPQPQYNPPAPEYQQFQPQYSPAAPEYQQPQSQYSPTPEYHQTQYSPPAPEYQQSQPQYSPTAPEYHQTQYSPTAPEYHQTQYSPTAPEYHQSQYNPAAPEYHQTQYNAPGADYQQSQQQYNSQTPDQYQQYPEQSPQYPSASHYQQYPSALKKTTQDSESDYATSLPNNAGWQGKSDVVTGTSDNVLTNT